MHFKVLGLVAVSLCFLQTIVLAGPASGVVRYVDDSAVGANDGTSWADAFTQIQTAIDAAVDGDEVLVADGVYTGVGNRNIDFGGKTITVRSADGAENCVIDCEEAGRGFTFQSGEGAESILEGFTITNGVGPGGDGGGIYCLNSSPTISDCLISGNDSGEGGGIHCSNSHPSISDCSIRDNSGHWGGGVFCRDSAPTLVRCDISNNAADGQGCGIASFNGSPSFENCTIDGNHPLNEMHDVFGGGAYCSAGNPSFTDCAFIGNSAYYGGGISGSATVTRCIIKGNAAYNGAGLAGNGFLTDCVISENVAENECGGIRGTPSLTNCLITRNSARRYGGISCFGALITNCIIKGNSATEYGGGLTCTNATLRNCVISENFPSGLICGSALLVNCTIRNNVNYFGEQIAGFSVSGGSPVVTNCIIWCDNLLEGNAASAPDAVFSYCNIIGSGGSANWNSAYGIDGGGNIDADPMFAFEEDSHLMAGSPCIDTGTSSPDGGLLTIDLDGNIRPVARIADMGAYEFNPSWPSIAVNEDHMEFLVFEGTLEPLAKVLNIRNAGGSMLMWEITEDCPWLDVSPTIGVSSGEINEVTLSVDVAGLSHGVYRCSVTIGDPLASNDPREVTVVLRVGVVHEVPAQFPTIQEAIDAALNGDIVVVADGSYTGQGNKYIDFKGKAVTVRSENGPEHCVVDCEGVGPGFQCRSGEGPDSVVEGFTIVNGVGYGGGIRCENSSPTIVDCWIMGCSSGANGGGIYCSDSLARIVDCRIVGNDAGSNGGGVYSFDGRPVVQNCVIVGNTGSEGAGVFCQGTIALTNCMIVGNTANYQGGGVRLESITGIQSRITNCAIVANRADRESGFSCSNDPIVTNCTFAGNINSDLARSTMSLGSGSSFSNCVLWNDGIKPNSWDSPPVIAHCNFSGSGGSSNWDGTLGADGGGNIDADPLFVRMPSAGPDETWGTADDDYGDLRVAAASPCVNAGNTSLVPADVTDLDGDGNKTETVPIDLAGIVRIIGAEVDIGAYESAITGLNTDFNDSGDVDADDVAVFHACMSGPGIWFEDGCAMADLDLDGDVDQSDFGILQGCLSGTGVAADPACVE